MQLLLLAKYRSYYCETDKSRLLKETPQRSGTAYREQTTTKLCTVERDMFQILTNL
jgi:hypothetical protein